ncbi:MAG: methyltransferase domain-containing protein [Moraxellaceae bacterium]|nr:methyltransferase domain-containing protein [Moraxellaceae bacterium]
MKKQNTRTKVIKTLLNVQNGLSLSNMLDGLLADVGQENKAFVHNLLLTSLRHWHATARLLDSLADKPIDEIEVRTTLQVGITQLLYLEVAEHACIFETVEAVKEIDFARASGLVNAILRKVAKNPHKYRKICNKKHSLPNWLAKQLKQDWRDNYNELCKSLRLSAPMFLRVNQRQTNIDDYLQQLTDLEILAEKQNLTLELANIGKTNNNLIHLKQSLAVNKLPNFATGMASVQDAHASLAGAMVKLLTDNLLENQAKKNLHILDACTAPSGKLAHCLEQFDSKNISKIVKTKVGTDSEGNDKFLKLHEKDNKKLFTFTAIDNDEKRLQRSEQTLERIGLTDEVKLICADASSWQFDREKLEQFDIILLDAPCTATGVIRRHPDIGLLRQETDIEPTAQLQQQILQNLWSQLKVGGYLIYITCSILKVENEMQMTDFIANHNNANEVKINGNWGIEQTIGRQCLPLAKNGGDGFYYAVLKKD